LGRAESEGGSLVALILGKCKPEARAEGLVALILEECKEHIGLQYLISEVAKVEN